MFNKLYFSIKTNLMINLHANNNLDKTKPRCCFIYIYKMYVYIYVMYKDMSLY